MPALNIPFETQPVTPLGVIVQVEQETERVQGGAYGFSVMDTITPFKNNKLLFTGLWDRYSRNFLVVREESRFSAVSRKSLSAVVRPIRYLSFTGSVKDGTALLGNPNLERGYTYGVYASAPGRVPIQTGYFRSLQINGGPYGSRFDLSQYSLQIPRWGRYAASAIYSELSFNGNLSRSLNETASVSFVRFGRFGFHDQVQLQNSHSYGPDWTLDLGRRGGYITLGMERLTSRGQPAFTAPLAAFNVPLPRGQSLKFSYFSMRGASVLQFEIGGPIVRRREVVNVNNQTALIVQSSLTGQVYRDVDLDGKFTPGVDRPIPEMKVTLDEDVATVTDPGGYFRFDGLRPGTHRLRAEISTLPASFIFANNDLIVAVMPYRANQRDFVAIPTGQIEGTVTLITLDETGTEVARLFPDARIIATGDRDTFSEGDGAFVLGDLPPGTYQLRLDPATVPASFVARPASQTVQVKPGRTVSGVALNIVKSVVVRAAPARAPQKRVDPGAIPPPSASVQPSTTVQSSTTVQPSTPVQTVPLVTSL
ncbi:MAG: carboxypeptidase-like regulatory domain-containing protein, partial [Bryobacteraceae bacterium]